MSKFINPFTDVGFKYLFGQSVNKEILISFLNALLEGEHHITDLEFIDKEQLPISREMRTLIYDIYCTTDTGEHIIVEMQNQHQKYFKDRALFYTAHSLAEQGVKGSGWRYDLTPVYGIFFMNFTWLDDSDKKIRTDVMLMDSQSGEVFSDRLRMIFLQLPLFDLREEECDTDFKKWLYVLKNMQTFERMPFAAQKAVFDKLGSIAEIAAMPTEQRYRYEQSLKVYRDAYDGLQTALEDGFAQGEAKGRAEGYAEGYADMLAKLHTKYRAMGMTEEQIAELLNIETL